MGQTKATCVHRFIASGTIEDTVRTLSTERRSRRHGATTPAAAAAAASTSASDDQMDVGVDGAGAGGVRDELVITRRDVLSLFHMQSTH